MKTRNGFVSNSSTSSFIVIGVKSTPAIKKHLLATENLIPLVDEYDADRKMSEAQRWEYFKDGLVALNEEDTSLEFYTMEDYDGGTKANIIGFQISGGETAKDIAELAERTKKMCNTDKEPKIFAWVEGQ